MKNVHQKKEQLFPTFSCWVKIVPFLFFEDFSDLSVHTRPCSSLLSAPRTSPAEVEKLPVVSLAKAHGLRGCQSLGIQVADLQKVTKILTALFKTQCNAFWSLLSAYSCVGNVNRLTEVRVCRGREGQIPSARGKAECALQYLVIAFVLSGRSRLKHMFEEARERQKGHFCISLLRLYVLKKKIVLDIAACTWMRLIIRLLFWPRDDVIQALRLVCYVPFCLPTTRQVGKAISGRKAMPGTARDPQPCPHGPRGVCSAAGWCLGESEGQFSSCNLYDSSLQLRVISKVELPEP